MAARGPKGILKKGGNGMLKRSKDVENQYNNTKKAGGVKFVADGILRSESVPEASRLSESVDMRTNISADFEVDPRNGELRVKMATLPHVSESCCLLNLRVFKGWFIKLKIYKRDMRGGVDRATGKGTVNDMECGHILLDVQSTFSLQKSRGLKWYKLITPLLHEAGQDGMPDRATNRGFASLMPANAEVTLPRERQILLNLDFEMS